MPDITKNPGVVRALREGRNPDDIAILSCGACGELGYYNQGSSFSCAYCKRGFRVVTQDEADDDDYGATGTMVIDECHSLQDILDAEPYDYRD
jgi:hypothetical protein